MDITRPIENPALVRAFEVHRGAPNLQNEASLISELGRADYLLPTLMNEARVTPSTPGRATIETGSMITFLSHSDANGGTWLPLFSDWPALRAWTSEPVDAVILAAGEAWDFALSRYAGAVINPATIAFFIDPPLLSHLKANHAEGA